MIATTQAIKEQSELPRMLPTHISPTAAKSYLNCSLRFYFERVACLPRPTSPALHLGKAIHAALQSFHLARWRGGDDSPEAAATAFEDAFLRLEREEGPVSYQSEEKRQKCRQDGLRVIAAYLDSSEAPKDKPRAVEVLLKEDIPGLSVPLVGAIDLVEEDYSPVDFKSAASKPDSDNARLDHELQLVSYQLLLEAVGETPPKLDLVYLVKTKAPQVIRVSAPPADSQRKERVIRMLDTAVEGIAEGRHHPQPGMQCSWCQFRNECAKWPASVGSKAAQAISRGRE
ncbi:MAG TPA: PD-(D/E)XK nuclease family protein [Candidatus Obscuribacterales bacterium]